MRRVLVIGLVGFLLATSCGGDGGEEQASAGGSLAVDSLSGLTVSDPNAALLFNLGDGDAAVVDGAANVDGTRRLAVTWTQGGERRHSVAMDLPAFIVPKAWSAAGALYVFGHTCPKPDFDLVGDVDTLPFEQVCGAPLRYAVRKLDLETGAWATVSAELPTGPDGKVFLDAGSGSTALLSDSEYTPMLLDTVSGAVETISAAALDPEPAGGPTDTDTTTFAKACSIGDGEILVVTARESIDDITSGQAAMPTVSVVRAGPNPVSSLDPPARDGASESFAPVDCLPGRGILGSEDNGSVSILTLGGQGNLDWETIELPEGAAGATGVRVVADERSLMAWMPDGEGLVPWLRTDDAWVRAGGVFDSLDPPYDVVAAAGRVLGLVRTADEPGASATIIAI